MQLDVLHNVHNSHKVRNLYYGPIRVLNVTPTTVTVDENSPLAGQNLTITVQLVSLKKGAGGNGAGTTVWPVPTNTL